MSSLLQDLHGRLKPVVLRRTGVALALWGEAGIGKTHAAGAAVQGAACRGCKVHSQLPLEELAKIVPRPGRLGQWAVRALEEIESGRQKGGAAEALAALLAALAPIVLHVEDLHESTPERLELWDDLARRARRMRGVALLATSRNRPPDSFEVWRLTPLSADASRELLEAEFLASLPTAATDWIYAHSLGNPLFTLEFARYLSRLGHLWSDGQRWHWRKPDGESVPPTVEVLIEHALDGVRRHVGEGLRHGTTVAARLDSERIESALNSRALLPPGSSAELWAAVSGLGGVELRAATVELERHGVFVKGEFAHPLYREVAVRRMNGSERCRFARRALGRLRDDPLRAVILLEHAELRGPEARELLESAAVSARQGNDLARAGRLLARAGDHAVGEQKGQLLLQAATVLDGVDYEAMVALAARAATYLADPSEALYLQATGLAVHGDTAAMRELLERLPPSYRQADSWLERYGKLLHRTGLHDELIELWENRPRAAAISGEMLYRVGWAYIHTGSVESAARLAEAWPALVREPGPEDVRSVGELRAALAFYRGRYAEAEEIYSELLASGQAHLATPTEGMGSPATKLESAANLLRNRAVTRLQLGRYREALPDIEQALETYARAMNAPYYAQTLVMSSYVHQELGELERTEEVLLEALEIFRRREAQPGLVGALVQLAELYLEWRRPAHLLLARKYAVEAMEVAQQLGQEYQRIVALCTLSRVRTAEGYAVEGLALAQDVRERAERLDYFEATISSIHSQGVAHAALGESEQARAALREAQRRAEERGSVLEAHRYGLELDRLHGNLEGARRRLAWFEEQGLWTAAATARRYFPQLADEPTEEVGQAVSYGRRGVPSGGRDPNLRATVLLPDASRLPRPAVLPRLDVLGSMRLLQGEQAVPVRGRKRQELLALLIEGRLAGREEVSRLELIDALYPGHDEAKAVGSLKQLVSNLRSDLSDSLIRTTAGGYALADVPSDAGEFLRSGDTSLWRGCFLEGISVGGRDTVRESLYLMLFEAAGKLIESDNVEAVRVARLLLQADPYDEDYLRVALTALRESRNYRTLGRIYGDARERFRELGETLPDSWTSFLAPLQSA